MNISSYPESFLFLEISVVLMLHIFSMGLYSKYLKVFCFNLG